jgi:peptidoglycan/xylan/chitin deacetylase (PgdA/CDA1 family)
LPDPTPATRTITVRNQHEITYWPDNKAGAVSLTFDDGFLSQYSLAVPVLNTRGFKGTFFIITHTMGNPYATWDNWRDAANMGHEIGSHTKTHPRLPNLSFSQMEDEIAGSKAEIDAQITSQKCLAFAYPYGALNDNAKFIAQNNYVAARGITCDLNSEPFDFYNMRACEDYLALHEMKAYTDAAEQQGKWLIPFFHSLDGTDYGFWRIGTLTEYLDYLQTKNLWVGTFGAVAKYIKERASANLSVVSSSSDQIVLSLTDTMDLVIPKSTWSLKSVDSQELVYENGAAMNTFDGNVSTIWHTQWYGGSPPHEIQIDLGVIYDIDGFYYLPRQDGGVNGRIGRYEFYVSGDGVNWGSPVATGTFANDATEKMVIFTPKTGRFVRLRALSEVNGNPWTSMAEINVLRRGSDPTYDQPLTMRSGVPSSWVYVSVQQGSSITTVRSTVEGPSTVIYYNAVPDRGLISLTPTVTPLLASVSVSPSTVVGGNTSSGTVRLDGPAPSGGEVVTLSSSNASVASVPASVTVLSGNTSATFTVTTRPVSSLTSFTISARYAGVTKTTILTVTP